LARSLSIQKNKALKEAGRTGGCRLVSFFIYNSN
jgi:hypothetical protein